MDGASRKTSSRRTVSMWKGMEECLTESPLTGYTNEARNHVVTPSLMHSLVLVKAAVQHLEVLLHEQMFLCFGRWGISGSLDALQAFDPFLVARGELSKAEVPEAEDSDAVNA